MLDTIIEQVTSNNIYLIIALVIAAFFVFSPLKKLFKFALLLIALAVIYIGYLNYSGQDPKKAINDMIEKGKEKLEQVKETADDVQETIDIIK